MQRVLCHTIEPFAAARFFLNLEKEPGLSGAKSETRIRTQPHSTSLGVYSYEI